MQVLFRYAIHLRNQRDKLSTTVATAVSAFDGTVTFSPASLPSAATNMLAQAVTGYTSSVNIAIERHP